MVLIFSSPTGVCVAFGLRGGEILWHLKLGADFRRVGSVLGNIFFLPASMEMATTREDYFFSSYIWGQEDGLGKVPAGCSFALKKDGFYEYYFSLILCE